MLLLARARTRVPPIQHCSKNAEYRGTENLKVLCRIPEFVVKTLDCGCRALAHSIGRVGRMNQLGEAARETSPFVVARNARVTLAQAISHSLTPRLDLPVDRAVSALGKRRHPV